MTFKEQQDQTFEFLRDVEGTRNLWSLTLVKGQLNKGQEMTARYLPPEEVRALQKEHSVKATKDTGEYAIEGPPFSLTDFGSEVAVFLSDGERLRPCHPSASELSTLTNPFYKASKYAPVYWIGPKSSTEKTLTLFIRPVPTADITNGIRLVFFAIPTPLVNEGDISVLPVRFHMLPVWYAVAIIRAKEGIEDAMRFWMFWRDALATENARYGRGTQAPEKPPQE